MTMGPRLRKIALTVHVACSVGSLGAVLGFLALAVAGQTSNDPGLVSAVYPSMDLVARTIIVPMILASLLTGLVQSLGTSWGLFRHWWVVAKLVLTIIVLVVLLLQLETIVYLADAAAANDSSDTHMPALRLSPVLHAAGGFLVLLLPVALSLYKPRGLTRYGWRKMQEER